MTDHRQKDAQWTIKPDQLGDFTWTQVQAALLMDIRDELKRLNSLLHCHNATGIPVTLRAIQRVLTQVRANTSKRRKKR